MRTNRVMRALALAGLGIALVGTPSTLAAGQSNQHSRVSPASATTLMVDNDGHATPGNCNGAAAANSTVQGAVDDATNGDTILVCPGTYVEQVTVVGYSNLTIKSVVPFAAKIKTPSSLNEPYLLGIGLSDNVTFQGFRLIVLARATNCDWLPFGILTSEASGIVIRANRIQTTGAKTLTGPCGYGTGIQVGEPSGPLPFTSTASSSRWGTSTADIAPSRASLSYNLIANFQVAGIMATGQTTTANIRHNSLHYFHLKDPQSGSCPTPFTSTTSTAGSSSIAGLAQAGASVLGVQPSAIGCFSVGIFQGDRAAGEISDNAVLSGPDAFFTASDVSPLLLAGIVQWDQRHVGGATSVHDNQVFRSIFGIWLLNGDGTKISDNHVWNTVIAIFVHQTQGVTVNRNRVNKNGAGIGINDSLIGGSGGPDDYARTSSGNVVKNNDARHNDLIGHDSANTGGYSTTFISCFDNTTGILTSGTANTWSGNQGETNSSDPLAICGNALL